MSLVILLILTILGLSSVQTTSLQERMSRNASDSNLAFQAAESALRDGEDMVGTGGEFNSMTSFDDYTGPGTGREQDPGDVPGWELVDWSPTSDSCTDCIPAQTDINGTASQPKYILEHVKTVESDDDRLNLNNIGVTTGAGKTEVFRVTAFGVGGTDSARVMLQSTYGVRY
jgi:type IV pilus assembly protein PilX